MAIFQVMSLVFGCVYLCLSSNINSNNIRLGIDTIGTYGRIDDIVTIMAKTDDTEKEDQSNETIASSSSTVANVTSGTDYLTTSNVVNPKHNFSINYHDLPVFRANRDKMYEMPILPLPPPNSHFPIEIKYDYNYPENSLENSQNIQNSRKYNENIEEFEFIEPKFDSNIHLNLKFPRSIVTLPDLSEMNLKNRQTTSKHGTDNTYDTDNTHSTHNTHECSGLYSRGHGPYAQRGSEFEQFGYSGESFQILSASGIKAMHDIVLYNKDKYAHRNFRNFEMRGLYYLSPFVRDFMNSRELLGHLGCIIGEPVIPHLLYMDAPSVNFGEIINEDDYDEEEVVPDHWHFDSVTYVCVILLSNITDMVGGDLEIVSENNKWHAIEKLINAADAPNVLAAAGLNLTSRNSSSSADYVLESTVNDGNEQSVRSPLNKKTVKYDESGKCVLIQGSEILHHVTTVRKAYQERISLVMAFQPSNAFVSDKTVLNTWQKFDYRTGTADYEFFRMQSWRLSHVLKYLALNQEFTTDGSTLAKELDLVKQELDRTTMLLNGKIQDNIGFYNELIKKYQF